MTKKIINIKQLPLHLQKAIRAEASNLNLKSKRRVVAATELSEEAKDWLDQVVKGTWTQRPDGKIDVDGSVDARSDMQIQDFIGKEVFFGNVSRNFNCAFTNITSLEGAPREVGVSFDCSHTNITSLEGAPREVGVSFDCSHTNITSLKGVPKVLGYFNCSHTNITSLEGAPREVREIFDCSHTKISSLKGSPEKVVSRFVGAAFNCNNTNITSLEGAPSFVGGSFNCSHTKLITLEGAPSFVGGSFNCSHTKLITLKGAPEEVGGHFNCSNTNITSLEGIGKVNFRLHYNDTPYEKSLKRELEPAEPSPTSQSISITSQSISISELTSYFVKDFKKLERINERSMLADFGAGDGIRFSYDDTANQEEQAKNLQHVKTVVSKIAQILKQHKVSNVSIEEVYESDVDKDNFGSDAKTGEGGTYLGIGRVYAIQGIPAEVVKKLEKAGLQICGESVPAEDALDYIVTEGKESAYPENTFFFALGASSLTIEAEEYDDEDDEEYEDED